MLAAFVLVLVTVPLTGGRLHDLRDPELRASWLLYLALAVQLVITVLAVGAIGEVTSRALHLGSYAIAGAWVVANRHLVGLWVAALGGACNLAAIAANGGQMPAAPAALARAGMAAEAEHFVNSGAVAGAQLQPLGDVFAVPAGWPLANVFSVGDVLLVVGAGLMVHHLAGSPWLTRHAGVVDLAVPRRRAGAARRWAPLLLAPAAVLALVPGTEGVVLAAVSVLLLLLADPSGPEVPLGRLIRTGAHPRRRRFHISTPSSTGVLPPL